MTPDSRITFLHGNDEYAIAKRIRELSAIFADPTQAEMNTARLDARTMTDNQWSNAIHSMPFLAAQRLVILGHPSARFPLRKSKTRAGDEAPSDAQGQQDEQVADEANKPAVTVEAGAEARKRFLDSLERMPSTTRLVIWETTEPKGADKHWLATWLRKGGFAVDVLIQPGETVMPGWIMQEAKRQGGEFTPPAAAALRDQVGSDTRQAAQEVTKLLTYVNWQRPVEPADVQALTPRTAESNIWKLVEALAQREGQQAQELLHRFFEEDEEYYVWAMIIRQFRLMILAREVLDARGGVREAMVAMRSGEYVAKHALEAARNFTMQRLEQVYHRLLEIDEGVKTGGMPLDTALDVLTVELTAR